MCAAAAAAAWAQHSGGSCQSVGVQFVIVDYSSPLFLAAVRSNELHPRPLVIGHCYFDCRVHCTDNYTIEIT